MMAAWFNFIDAYSRETVSTSASFIRRSPSADVPAPPLARQQAATAPKDNADVDEMLTCCTPPA